MERLEKVAKWSMLLGAMAILFGIGKTTGIFKGKNWKMNEFMGFTTAVTDSISKILRLYASYCQLLTLSSQIALAMKKIEMDMVRVTVCMETVQHELDIGRCSGREQACFNQLTSCMNLGNINSWVSNMNSVISQSTQILNTMKSDTWSLYRYGNQYFGSDSTTSRGSGLFNAWVNCGGKVIYGGKCGSKCGTTSLILDTSRQGCSRVDVYMQPYTHTLTNPGASVSISTILEDLNTCPGSKTSCKVTYRVVCIDSNGNTKNTKSVSVTYVKDTTDGCSGLPSSQYQSQTSYLQTLNYEKKCPEGKTECCINNKDYDELFCGDVPVRCTDYGVHLCTTGRGIQCCEWVEEDAQAMFISSGGNGDEEECPSEETCCVVNPNAIDYDTWGCKERPGGTEKPYICVPETKTDKQCRWSTRQKFCCKWCSNGYDESTSKCITGEYI